MHGAEAEMPETDASFLTRLEAWLGAIANRVATVCVTGMLLIAGITLVDVLLRWILHHSIPAFNEVVAMTFAVAISACIPAGIARDVNLRVDLLLSKMTPRVETYLKVVGAAAMVIFFGLLVWRMFVFAATTHAQWRTTSILSLPQAPFMYAVAGLFAFALVIQVVITINATRRAIMLLRTSPYFATALRGTLVIGVVVAALVAAWLLFDMRAMSTWARTHVGWTVVLAFIIMWVLTVGQIPLVAVMALAGIASSSLFIGFEPALSAGTTEAITFLTDSQVATLPLFLMMGSFAATANLSEDVYRLAHALLGRLRGGLALATIGACAGFGSLTGSSMATAVTIGRVALPEMRARGYSPALSTGCCAAGGTLGALMPPASGPLILFALLSQASIGQLFVAAILPGLLAIVLYLITVVIYVRVSPSSAPVAAQVKPGETMAALRGCGPAALLFGSVLGGIYSGVFTASEGASVGAFVAFLVCWWRGRLSGGSLWRVMAETTATTAMIYGLIFGAQIFSLFVAVSGVTQTATEYVSSLGWAPIVVIAVICVVYLILGSVMESFAVLVITIPIVTPLVLDIGYDIVWWGIINLCIVETGLIHPPLGLNVFVLKSMQPDVSIWTIYKGVTPFVVADLFKLVLLIVFPSISLWLVATMM